MTLVYFDSSALVKLFVPEVGSELAERAWDESAVPMSSRLAYPEVRAALAASVRRGILSPTELSRATRSWDELWSAAYPVELTAATAQRAGELAERHALSGADAVHLASALVAAPGGVVMVVWDGRLREAALVEGMPVVPAA